MVTIKTEYASRGKYLFALFLLAGLIALIPPAACTECLSLVRTVSADTYDAGQELTVELTLQNSCTETLTSLGIEELLPDGWTFLSGETVSGADPVQWLAPGSTDTLEIFWITVPTSPVVLRYSVKAPETTTAQAVFSGHAVYSFTSGDQHNSDVTETSIAPASTIEGEGEGEQPEGEATEGETVEGEAPEGERIEGEIPAEGEVVMEGEVAEGEPPQEGADEGEGETENPASTGCCRRQTNKTQDYAGDSLFVACSLFLFVLPYKKK